MTSPRQVSTVGRHACLTPEARRVSFRVLRDLARCGGACKPQFGEIHCRSRRSDLLVLVAAPDVMSFSMWPRTSVTASRGHAGAAVASLGPVAESRRTSRIEALSGRAGVPATMPNRHESANSPTAISAGRDCRAALATSWRGMSISTFLVVEAGKSLALPSALAEKRRTSRNTITRSYSHCKTGQRRASSASFSAVRKVVSGGSGRVAVLLWSACRPVTCWPFTHGLLGVSFRSPGCALSSSWTSLHLGSGLVRHQPHPSPPLPRVDRLSAEFFNVPLGAGDVGLHGRVGDAE